MYNPTGPSGRLAKPPPVFSALLSPFRSGEHQNFNVPEARQRSRGQERDAPKRLMGTAL